MWQGNNVICESLTSCMTRLRKFGMHALRGGQTKPNAEPPLVTVLPTVQPNFFRFSTEYTFKL